MTSKVIPSVISTRPLPDVFQDLAEIASYGQRELDVAYRRASMGPIPDGPSRGRALFFPGKSIDEITSAVAGLVWQGKVFHKERGYLLNKIVGFESVKAQIYEGKSLMDAQPACLIDYGKTSWLVPFIQDEIRLVGAGLYLGRAYFKTARLHRFLLSFALDFNKVG